MTSSHARAARLTAQAQKAKEARERDKHFDRQNAGANILTATVDGPGTLQAPESRVNADSTPSGADQKSSGDSAIHYQNDNERDVRSQGLLARSFAAVKSLGGWRRSTKLNYRAAQKAAASHAIYDDCIDYDVSTQEVSVAGSVSGVKEAFFVLNDIAHATAAEVTNHSSHATPVDSPHQRRLVPPPPTPASPPPPPPPPPPPLPSASAESKLLLTTRARTPPIASQAWLNQHQPPPRPSNRVATLQFILGHQFANVHILEDVLPTLWGNMPTRRAALIGDKVLGLVLVQKHIEAGYDAVGHIQTSCQQVWTNRNLDRVGRRFGLDMYTPSRSMKDVATLMEALIGAVYMDGGLNAAAVVMRNLTLL